MLSPNARIVITPRRGAGSTTETLNVQLAVRCAASVAVQPTVVVPTANADPLGGEQLTETGTVPLVTVAAP
jgi:hypothetical protein